MNFLFLAIGLTVLVQNDVFGVLSLNPAKDLLSGFMELPAHSRVARAARGVEKVKVSRVIPEEVDEDDNNLMIKKRESHGPIGNIFTPAYCKKLGNKCAQSNPKDQILCLQNCVMADSPVTKMYANFIPSIVKYLCLTVNTIIANLPMKNFRSGGSGKITSEEFWKSLNLDDSDLPEFAKTSANALVVAMIKRSNGDDIDMLKTLVNRLEQLDSAPKDDASSDGDMLAEFGSGKFTNKNCDAANLNGDAILLSELMKRRNCLLDIMMPGYYLITRAPTFIKNHRVMATVRGFNVPLFMFTGVPCCLIPYKENNGTVWKCVHAEDLLTDSQKGMLNPTRRVCGAIPDYEPSVKLNQNITEPEGNEGEVECDPEESLYSEEGEEPCKKETEETGEPAGAAGNTTLDYSKEADDDSAHPSGRANPNIPNPNFEEDMNAAYGENAPPDEAFYAL